MLFTFEGVNVITEDHDYAPTRTVG